MDLSTAQKLICLNVFAFTIIFIYILIGTAPNLDRNGFKPETWFVYRDLNPSDFWFSIIFHIISFIVLFIICPLIFIK